MARVSYARPAVPVRPTANRVPRFPVHTFSVSQKPFTIQPVCIAPVLAGETLKNLTWQSRCVTDPIANGLIGWWLEYYWFYVKLRDLDARDVITAALIDPAGTWPTAASGDSLSFFHRSGQIPWTELCLKRVVEEFFRDEGETWNNFTLTVQGDAIPIARINQEGWWNSIIDETDVPVTDLDTADVVTDQAISRALQTYEWLQSVNMTTMSFEDYLKAHGIRGQAAEEAHVPELIRVTKAWQYPTNTIDPLTGNPSSAVSWAIQERADKDRFFTEPGFILGVSVARPKIYYREQDGAGVCHLNHAFSWLPDMLLATNPEAAIREVDNANGSWAGATNDYLIDNRDLFLYGDQHINATRSSNSRNFVDLPTAALQHRYIDNDDARNFFAQGETPADKFIRQDGVASFSILGRQQEHTPTTAAIM